MPIDLKWPEIALRLLCALVAGGLIGLKPTERGRAAGIRAAMLVCLAACIAMLQVNLLLPLSRRAANSFVMNDLMRVLGLCFGGGQVALGAVGTALAIVILAGVKYIEDRIKQDHQGKLLVVTDATGPSEHEILSVVAPTDSPPPYSDTTRAKGTAMSGRANYDGRRRQRTSPFRRLCVVCWIQEV